MLLMIESYDHYPEPPSARTESIKIKDLESNGSWW